jgi:GH18 family chitinase
MDKQDTEKQLEQAGASAEMYKQKIMHQDVVQVLDRMMCGLYTYDLHGQYNLVFYQQRTM